jgi:hypothetical protein
MPIMTVVRPGRQRCNRYLQTTLNIIQFIMAYVVVIKLATPDPLSIDLLNSWTMPVVVDIFPVNSTN